ncbi:MAG: phosphotransferase [Chloroflexi bacterium]|jgi:protein-ribulosamine 3-kinase|nr:phosphotransferase [Chloroflexota bacterium]
MLPPPVIHYLKSHNYGAIQSTRPVDGGCISNGVILWVASGETFFLKTNRRAPADMFAREADGLEALNTADGPVVPRPLLWGDDFLLMDDLTPAPRQKDYWPEFGRRLAALHQHTNPQFGFAHNNHIGSTPQPNPWMQDGFAFFAEQRLGFQAQLAYDSGLLSATDKKSLDKLIARLPNLIPAQPASLLHGDLWSGNAISDRHGAPAIIDPAAHYGWAESELAMTTLFGAFPEVFYRAYEETRSLEGGYRSRFPLYNLYHLLNHVNLFGRSYLEQIQAILRHYV